ncbi:MAG: carbohydrate-binding protein [Akkermansiaceae bacterium]
MRPFLALTLFGTTFLPAEWKLVWSDEFEGSGELDQSKWNFESFEPGANNNELQKYTHNRLENCRCENGILILEGRRDWWYDEGQDNTYEYTSARIQTAGKFNIKYGRIEMRALMPHANGAWPAFWMMPNYGLYGGWPDSGEIDILEYVGWDNDKAHVNAHTKDRNFLLGTNYGWSGHVGGLEDSYHTYAVEWWHDRIDFYIDGIWRYGFSNEDDGFENWPFNSEFFIILNHAIGGWGGVMGIDTGAYDTHEDNYGVGYFIDYVRAYKWDWPTHTIPAHVEAEHYHGYSGDVREEKATDIGDGWNVGYIDTGDYLQYRFNIPENGTYQISYRVASDHDKGILTLGKSGTDIQQTPIPDTGGWQSWQTITEEVSLEQGVQTLDLYATQGGWNLNHFKISTPPPSLYFEAEYYDHQWGTQEEPTTDTGGGLNIGYIDDRDWMSYDLEIPIAGTYRVTYRVASINSTGIVTLGRDGNDLAQTPVPNTGDWQNWQTIADTVDLEAGQQSLTVYATQGGWNINWWSLEFLPTDFDNWEAAYDLTGTGPYADSDNDGRTNRTEYLFGTDPTSAQETRAPSASRTASGYPTFTYSRRLTPHEATYQIETSPDLTIWTPCLRSDNAFSPHTYTLQDDTGGHSDGSQTLTIRYNQPTTRAPLFFRLKALAP